MRKIHVRQIGYALGAEITGVDLRLPLDSGTIAQIRDAWIQHLILCFPGQELTAAQLVAFTNYFGELDDNEISKNGDPENRNVILLTNKPIAGKPWNGYKNGQNWHSDQSFTERPTTGTFVLCKEIPQVGGDTMFTNMYMAYETLSETLKAIIEQLHAVHDILKIKNIDQRPPEQVADLRRKNPPVVHSVVTVHPESGKKTLFVGDRVSKFVGMSDEESQPLLRYLTQHAVAYEFTYRHQWRVNDLIMWDNRCTMHIAISDYDISEEPRHLLRCSLLGPQTGHFYTPDVDAPLAASQPHDPRIQVS